MKKTILLLTLLSFTTNIFCENQDVNLQTEGQSKIFKFKNHVINNYKIYIAGALAITAATCAKSIFSKKITPINALSKGYENFLDIPNKAFNMHNKENLKNQLKLCKKIEKICNEQLYIRKNEPESKEYKDFSEKLKLCESKIILLEKKLLEKN
ncbi:hypothetical protein KJ644_03535 [Candidatus Dependentiae bacterium]|nr:hypothetical protein [Candidatus Dependentiae bacterium]MBU4387519.1 hypothetical protein [Candidatus Dependentiae bacterium]MCG2756558.1 hypothetical protein [Candidatus Dependentiae bacterium]